VKVAASWAKRSGISAMARRLLLADAATSTVAAIALGIAATGTAANVFAVFGLWAGLSGAVQLVTAIRRRAKFGLQWPTLLAGGAPCSSATRISSPQRVTIRTCACLAFYAAGGGIEFIIQAWLLERRRRHELTASPAQMRTVKAHAHVRLKPSSWRRRVTLCHLAAGPSGRNLDLLPASEPLALIVVERTPSPKLIMLQSNTLTTTMAERPQGRLVAGAAQSRLAFHGKRRSSSARARTADSP
jgi:hypothetical protein